MNDRRLTDDQISAALHRHLPGDAPVETRRKLLDAVEVTPQERPLFPVLGWVSHADPVGMRTSLLLLIALLLAAALAGLAAAGAWRVFRQETTPRLDLTPPANVSALVGSTYNRMPDLPPVAITVREAGAAEERIYVDGSGAVRFEYYASPGAATPDTYRILSGTTIGALVSVDSRLTWVERAGAIAEDPRVFLLAELEGGGVKPGCEVTGRTANVSAPVGWSYVGTESVAGRPAYHVTCSGGDLWIDAATSLILRSRGPGQNAADTIEVMGLEFGQPPADLFRLAPPAGVPSMSADAYDCQLNAAACATPPPTPTVTLPPGAVSGPIASLAPLHVSNGWIAYSTDGPKPGATDSTQGSDLYLVREGGQPTLVAGREGGATRNSCPAFSPDGTRLAYGVVASAGWPAIVVRGVNAAGATGEITRITVPGTGLPPCVRWSADGRRLAYLDGGTEVVVGLDGSSSAPARGDPSPADLASPTDGVVQAPLRSPSGAWVASVRGGGDTGACQLVVGRPDGTHAHALAISFCPYAIAAWSPDGTRILLMEDVSGTDFTMHEVDIGTGAQSVVVSTVRTNGARSWPGQGDVSWQPVHP